uniref:Uncharacterized protein n=1 Tax=Timema tahoe TaxID=61484 RepID=A0A7R9IFI5_9NEOP|nr:unnamed protein product [Timema tahoe]
MLGARTLRYAAVRRGIRNVLFRGSVPEFAWRESGKTTVNTPNRDSNLDLPVISSPVYSKSSALDHAATEVGHKLMLIKEQRRRKMSKKQEFPHLESISRITRLPVVESSLILASGFYSKVKCSSSLIHWGLTKAESSVHGALGRAIPAANALEKPINLLDTAMCRGLDVVEKKLPAITLPPTMTNTRVLCRAGRGRYSQHGHQATMGAFLVDDHWEPLIDLPGIVALPILYASTKDYVSTTLVQPVLRRADSVLSCKYTNLAAEKIDSALDVADKYVDQYLPKTADENTGNFNKKISRAHT